MEVVAFVWPYGNEARCHREAVKVARDVAVHVGELVGVEIVRRRESEVPVFGRLDIA